MANVSVFCFLASYAVALALECTRLLRLTAVSRWFMLAAGTAGLVAHTSYLVIRSGKTSLPPLLASSQDWMLVLAWLAIVFYLFLTSVDRDLAIGLFLLPLVLALIGAAYFVSDSPSELVARDSDVTRYYWAMLHASLLVLGIAGVLVGLVLSLMYLVQHYRLKHHQTLQRGLRLPSLERLARLNWWAVMISVPLLTLGLATGVGLIVFQDEAARPIRFTDPVVIVSGVAWLAMVVFAVWLFRKERPVGKQVAWLTVWAFGFLLVTLVGLQVLTSGGRLSLETWHAGVETERQRDGETERGGDGATERERDGAGLAYSAPLARRSSVPLSLRLSVSPSLRLFVLSSTGVPT